MSVNMPFLSYATVRKNANALAAALGIEDAVSPASAYVRALASIQGWNECLGADSGPSMFFQGGSECNAAFAHFLCDYELPAIKPFSVSEISEVTAAIEESLDLLAKINDDLRATFDLLVRTLLIVRIPAFGGRSDALGLVMAGPEADWSRLEIAELLWHEAVHQAVFLEDLVNPLFSTGEDQLVTPEARVHNPLLGTDRSLDLAFHGAAVSTAILDLHLRAASHRKVLLLLPGLALTIHQLTARRHFMTERGGEILDELVSAVRTIAAEAAEISAQGKQHMGEHPSRRSYLDLQPSWRTSH